MTAGERQKLTYLRKQHDSNWHLREGECDAATCEYRFLFDLIDRLDSLKGRTRKVPAPPHTSLLGSVSE